MNIFHRLPQMFLGLLALLIILPMLATAVGDILVQYIQFLTPYVVGGAVLFLLVKLGLALARRWS